VYEAVMVALGSALLAVLLVGSPLGLGAGPPAGAAARPAGGGAASPAGRQPSIPEDDEPPAQPARVRPARPRIRRIAAVGLAGAPRAAPRGQQPRSSHGRPGLQHPATVGRPSVDLRRGPGVRAQPVDAPAVPAVVRLVRAPARLGDMPRWPRWRVIDPHLVRVVDGDTFAVGAWTIRLRGIDTPEIGEPRALLAKQRLATLLSGGPITVIRRAEDVYGRIVADVYVDGRNVAAVLRAEGFDKSPG